MRAELVEVMARTLCRHEFGEDADVEWAVSPEFWRENAAAALDAALTWLEANTEAFEAVLPSQLHDLLAVLRTEGE